MNKESRNLCCLKARTFCNSSPEFSFFPQPGSKLEMSPVGRKASSVGKLELQGRRVSFPHLHIPFKLASPLLHSTYQPYPDSFFNNLLGLSLCKDQYQRRTQRISSLLALMLEHQRIPFTGSYASVKHRIEQLDTKDQGS